MVEIISEYPAPSDAELDEIERVVSFKLPVEYREFLQKHNGGEPNPRWFRSSYPHTADLPIIDVHFFLGVHSGFASLEYFFGVFQGRIPTDLLPIAADMYGNMICLGLSQQRYQKVFFWDHEQEDDEASYDNVYLVADSFLNFLGGSFELNEDEC